MIFAFPPEIFGLIIEKLEGVDLKSFSQVSKRAHAAVVQLLWQSITIEPAGEDVIHRIRTTGLPRHRFSLATQLHFRSSFEHKTRNRCPHTDRDVDDAESIPSPLSETEDGLEDDDHASDYDFDDDEDNRPNFKLVGRKAQSIIKRVEKGRLRSFSWDLGTCVPSEILGPYGIVSLKQPLLSSLSLITDPRCEAAFNYVSDIDLSAFRWLQSLSWKGPHAEQLDALSCALLSNAGNLQKITLDFMNWEDMAHDLGYETDEEVESSDYFLRSVLYLKERSPSPLFPKIRVLFLSQVPLGKAMAPVINFNTLSSLTLRKCPGWHEFLEGALDLKHPIYLRKLETQDVTDGDLIGLGESSLRRLLTSFEGLQELYISEARPFDTIDVWQHVAAHHRASLRKFVYHQRAVNVDEDSSLFGGENDLPNLGISRPQMRQLIKDELHNPFADLDLECLGLSCKPERLKYLLRPFVWKGSLKLLHIRQSSIDILNSASLAFKRRRMASETDSEIDEFGAEESQDTESPSTSPDPGPQNDTEEDSRGVNMQEVDSFTGEMMAQFRKEFVQFARWVFGPQGVASLRIVAFGDFAHGRFSQECIMLYRDPDTPMNFRVLGVHRPEFKRIHNAHRDFLGACPVQPLLGEKLF